MSKPDLLDITFGKILKPAYQDFRLDRLGRLEIQKLLSNKGLPESASRIINATLKRVYTMVPETLPAPQARKILLSKTENDLGSSGIFSDRNSRFYTIILMRTLVDLSVEMKDFSNRTAHDLKEAIRQETKLHS